MHHFDETSNEYRKIKRLYDSSLKLRGADLDGLRAKEFKFLMVIFSIIIC